jgi:hypothetical protein
MMLHLTNTKLNTGLSSSFVIEKNCRLPSPWKSSGTDYSGNAQKNCSSRQAVQLLENQHVRIVCLGFPPYHLGKSKLVITGFQEWQLTSEAGKGSMSEEIFGL